MQISMYRASIPVLVRSLKNLQGVLRKGEASATSRNIDPSVLLNYRLAPDMFPLTRQVQVATDMAKGCAARLAGVDVPSWDDKEASFADLYARIDKAIAFVEGFQPSQIDGSEARNVVLKMRTGEMTFAGVDYLFDFVLPNVLFHCTAAYAILRHCGVEIGKRDFLGGT
jgi:hypothetical protein